MNMNKTNFVIALSVALLWACSDSPNEAGTTEIDNTVAQNDSSSSSVDNSSSSVDIKHSSSSELQSSSSDKAESSNAFAEDTKRGLKLGFCISSGLEQRVLAKRSALIASVEDSSEELPKAYILQDGKGNYQVMILNVMDLCQVEADLLTKRSGDTLEIEYGEHHMETTCSCYSDHWFDIDANNKNVKFVRFSGITYEISEGSAPEPTKREHDYSVMDDSRDSKTYKTVQLEEGVWMAENLNYEMEDGVQSWCNENKTENCDKYGRLYTLKAANSVCPSGWHLPSIEEWPFSGNGGYSAFYDYAAQGWKKAIDKYGFAALPAGEYSAEFQKFFEPGTSAYFWTSTIDTRNNDCPVIVEFSNSSAGMISVCADNENDGLSVRCVKDSE
ncbi:major paralogous domain-containing protein [Fibrobacter sp. UWEL]|nr:major paralogous domain-containing protein [Fibrobacter sp. UWEL]